MLVRIIKNWSYPDLLRQTPGSTGIWDGIQYTSEPVEECDLIIVLNRVPGETTVRCAPENVWAVMQEPYIRNTFEWMVEGHGQFQYVFTHHPKRNFIKKKYIRNQPLLPWHVDANYDELKNLAIPRKRNAVSWVTSNLTFFPGHKLRMGFLGHLQSSDVPVDIYGRGIKYIENKWDALASYRYSLAIENSSGPDYWTEKIADCFLSWTVPIYYGCTNLEDYFPEGSFIRIDINRPESALKIIKGALGSHDWHDRLAAVNEARNQVLERYQFFPQMSQLISKYYKDSSKQALSLKPYHAGKKVIRNIRRMFQL